MSVAIHNVDGGFGKRTRTTIIPTERYIMKASDARKLSEEGQMVNMADIYNHIANRAREGYECLTINVQKWKHVASVDKVTTELRLNGYTVRRNRGFDQRDGDSWDNIEISWSAPVAKSPEASDHFDR